MCCHDVAMLMMLCGITQKDGETVEIGYMLWFFFILSVLMREGKNGPMLKGTDVAS
jgi:hypothetical protein